MWTNGPPPYCGYGHFYTSSTSYRSDEFMLEMKWSRISSLAYFLLYSGLYSGLVYTLHILFLSCPNLSYLFMLTQEVSKMPISRSTPSRMSLMTSGGMRRERISDKASALMFPTACFASSTKGYSRETQVKAKHASPFRFWSKAKITSFI